MKTVGRKKLLENKEVARRQKGKPRPPKGSAAALAPVEAVIETDPLYADTPVRASYAGSVLRRIGPCCVEVEMDGWVFSLTAPDGVRLQGVHVKTGRRLPP